MKKRLLKLGMIALLLLGLFVAYLRWTTPTSGINWFTANRIQIGMTHDEVVAILGEHPSTSTIACGPGGTQCGYEWRSSCNEQVSIRVQLDVNGKVMAKSYDSDLMTFLDKCRRWLHLD